jgi:pimeloyl-ACP methyl ester carboxylesterase
LFVANSDDRRVPKEIAFELSETVGPTAEVLIVPGASHGGAWRNGTAAYQEAAASILEAAQGTTGAARVAANEDASSR